MNNSLPRSATALLTACLIGVVITAAVMLNLGSSADSVSLAEHTTQLDASYRPVVVIHGITNPSETSDILQVAANIREQYPGIYVTALNGYVGDQSYSTPMDMQLARVVEAIQSDANLRGGFDLYGESQGGLLARAYVTTVNNPRVHNLVSICGPQSGVGQCPFIEGRPGKNCGSLGTRLDIYQWPNCSFCGYWRGVEEEIYLENSIWLADINNQKAFNGTRRDNMRSLNQYMATYATEDEIVQPPQSAHHEFWQWGDLKREKVVKLQDTEGYKKDLLGLQTLDRRGGLILNSFVGPHVGYNWTWWNKTVLPMFGH